MFDDSVGINEDLICTLPIEVQDALHVFSEEERSKLFAAFDAVSGDFLGIGFKGVGGVFTRHANIDKWNASQVIEDFVAKDLGLISGYEKRYRLPDNRR